MRGPLDYTPVAKSAALDPDGWKPGPTVNPTPIVYGRDFNVQGTAARPGYLVLVQVDGLNGPVFSIADIGGAGNRMDNGVPNLSQHGWGGVVKYHRHDDAAFVLNTGTKTTLASVGLQFAHGGDGCHSEVANTNLGNKWTYSPGSCNRIGILLNQVGSNSGNILVAVDGDPLAANGFAVKTVTSAQEASGEFGTGKIASLPAPWNGLSTLVGCKYISAVGTEVNQFAEVWYGAEAVHILTMAPSSSSPTSNTRGREYFSGGWCQSTSFSALTSTYAPPSIGVNKNGFAVGIWAPGMRALSMQEPLEEIKPGGATNSRFNGGNHQDGGSISQESCASGCYGFYAATTAGSAVASQCSNIVDIQNNDKYVAWSCPPQLLAASGAASPSGTTFNLSGNASLGTTNPVRFDRADWTVPTGTTNATQTLSGVTGILEGDTLTFIGASTKAVATVLSISGNNVTFDRAITTVDGMYVLKYSDYHAPVQLFESVPVFVRPYEIHVCSSQALISCMRHVRSHPELGTTLTAAVAKGDTVLPVTAVSGLAGIKAGKEIAIMGADTTTSTRHVARVLSITALNVTIDRPLPHGFANGSRVAPAHTSLTTARTFRTADTYQLYFRSVMSGYTVGDTITAAYQNMKTVDSPGWLDGASWSDSNGKTYWTWSNASTDSSNVNMQAVAMNLSRLGADGATYSKSGISMVSKSFVSGQTGRYQTRTATAPFTLSKFYLNGPAGYDGVTTRNPSTTVVAEWAMGYRTGFAF